jgi:Ca2+-binding EF-hand superfamily protein
MGGKREVDEKSYAMMGKKPLGSALVNYFIEESLVENGDLTEDDLKIREIARDLNITFPEIEKVKRVFDKYDEDGSGLMEKDEFALMMKDLICVGKLKGQEVPRALLENQWRGVDHDGSGEVEFDEFCEWYFFAYLPMMAEMESKASRHSAAALKANGP